MNKGKHLLETVHQFISRYGLIAKQDKVLVGLSGGADSVCLLHVMLALRSEYNLSIAAVHVNHMLRGEAADRDAAFCRQLCDRLGISLHVSRVDVRALASESGQGIEEAARQVRYQCFASLKQQLQFNKIATAHNQNDNAETSLMYFLRGSGIDGLKGIMPIRPDGVIRPLLGVSRKNIEAFLSEIGQDFVTDESNFQTDYTRNQIRNTLIPELEAAYNPKLVESLSRHALLLAQDAEFLNQQARDALLQCFDMDKGAVVLYIDKLLQLSPAIGQRVIRMAGQRVIPNIDSLSYDTVTRVYALAAAAVTTGCVPIGNGISARRCYDKLYFLPEDRLCEPARPYQYMLTIGQPCRVPEAGITILASRVETVCLADKNTVYFDFEKIAGKLMVRNRRKGDAFVPFGMKGKKKLKDFYIDEKVPHIYRDINALVVLEDEILWVCGLRRSEGYRVTDKTASILKITYWEE